MQVEKRVVIVGAGPVGLATALALSSAGVPVLLLEADNVLPTEQRGAAFHPPTLEMLSALGVGEAVLAQGLRVPIWQMRDREEGVVAEFDLSLLAHDTAFPFRLHLPQHFLSSILLDALRIIPDCEIRFGVRLADIKEHGDHAVLTLTTATGTETISVPWVVGADGAHSVVRRALQIRFDGFTWPEKFLVTNIDYPLEQLGYTGTAYVSDPDRWAVVLRLADPVVKNLWRIAMPADPAQPDEVLLDPLGVLQRLQEVLPSGPAYPLIYAATYRVHQRVASTFFTRRVFLAGDAAHINNPLGGFGLNGGIHDAVNLAERLAKVWHGVATPGVCEQYSRQRRSVAIDVVQRQSIRNKKAMEERHPAARAANREVLRDIASDPVKAREFLLDSSMIRSVRQAAAID